MFLYRRCGSAAHTCSIFISLVACLLSNKQHICLVNVQDRLINKRQAKGEPKIKKLRCSFYRCAGFVGARASVPGSGSTTSQMSAAAAWGPPDRRAAGEVLHENDYSTDRLDKRLTATRRYEHFPLGRGRRLAATTPP